MVRGNAQLTTDITPIARPSRRWLLQLCDLLSAEECDAAGCKPAFADGRGMLVRHEGGIAKRSCWTDELQAWLANPDASGAPARLFEDVPADEVTDLLHAFVEAHPQHAANLDFSSSADTPSQPDGVRACRLLFESTFVAPQVRSVPSISGSYVDASASAAAILACRDHLRQSLFLARGVRVLCAK